MLRQQIIWVKQIHALSRAHYQWRHEPCWYAVRKGAKANWQGGRKQTTVWEAASPIAGFGGGGGEDTATPHPTQKPVELYERAILNHTQPGGVVFDPFAGSGTALVAAERHGRVCAAIELDRTSHQDPASGSPHRGHNPRNRRPPIPRCPSTRLLDRQRARA